MESEKAGKELPALLAAAEKGCSTLITRHGRSVAAIVPVEDIGTAGRQQPLTPVAGTGRGLWGADSIATVRRLRDEWSR